MEIKVVSQVGISRALEAWFHAKGTKGGSCSAFTLKWIYWEQKLLTWQLMRVYSPASTQHMEQK